MMLDGAALAALLRACAPSVGPRTMAAVISVESRGNPNAIDDDTAHRSYAPATRADAERIATRLEAAGDNYDAGLAQVNSANFAAYGLSVSNAFDPCANVRAGSLILTRAYARALQTPPGARAAAAPGGDARAQELALARAFSIYNSGSPSAALAYARRVIDAAQSFAPHAPAAPLARRLRLVKIDLARVARDAGL